MTLAAVAVAATMNAQLYVGGGLGFTSQNDKTERPIAVTPTTTGTRTVEITTTSIEFLPEVGYKLNDKMAVGAEFGISFAKKEYPEYAAVNAWGMGTLAKGEKFELSGTEIAFKPYFRYFLVNWDKVSLFVDGQVGITSGKYTGDYTDVNGATQSRDIKTTGFSIAVKPGIAFQASKKSSLVAKLGNGFGYFQDKTTTPVANPVGPGTVDMDETTSKFGLNLNSLGLQFGAYYNF